MLRLFKKKSSETAADKAVGNTIATPLQEESAKASWFSRLKNGLSRTRQQLTTGLGNLFLGKKVIDAAVLEQLEQHLLTADVGVALTEKIIKELTARVTRKQLTDSEALLAQLQQLLREALLPCEKKFIIPTETKPWVILFVGINGAGKTTTIGKLAKQFQAEGKSVLLAAGDTFRAAAIEQLQTWGERNQIPVVAQHEGADSAAVIFDAINSAKARNIDIVLADTAGRLHTQQGLLEELKKIKRVMQKIDPAFPHEIWLILDASIGQNALLQAQQFGDAMAGITGIVMTKLDGTAKGGILFAIANQSHIPIRFIGVGESIDDLKPFHAEEFVAALFSN